MSDQRVTPEQKRFVEKRAQGCCEYCGSLARYAPQSFTIEHIVPRSKGGETILENLAFSCPGCNGHKYNKTHGYDPVSGQMAALYHPRQQNWHEHFSWNSDYSIIIGLTPTGRATLETLQLNRACLINLRRLLSMRGEHPPAKFIIKQALSQNDSEV